MSADVFTLAREMTAIRTQTRRSHGASMLLHGALLLWFVLHRQLAPAPEHLVEVSWLEPAPVAAPAAAAPVSAAPRVPAPAAAPAPATTPEPQETRFQRETEVAEQAPRPQDDTAHRDAVQSRLESLRATRQATAALAAAANPGSRLAAAAAPTGAVRGTAPAELVRETAAAPATALERSGEPARRPALAAAVPAPSAPARALPETPATDASERIPGSARLTGEVAARPVVHHEMPAYPEWATRDAVEADVTLRFVVRPDGSLASSVQVERTAGFLDFDDAAVAALRRWRFAPLAAGQTTDQWGTITFHFRLRDQR